MRWVIAAVLCLFALTACDDGEADCKASGGEWKQTGTGLMPVGKTMMPYPIYDCIK